MATPDNYSFTPGGAIMHATTGPTKNTLAMDPKGTPHLLQSGQS
jgi:hypothetical protein